MSDEGAECDEVVQLVVGVAQAGTRVEQLVRDATGASRAEARALFDAKQVQSQAGRVLRRGDRARTGDVVCFPDLASTPWVRGAPEIALTVLLEAPDLVAVDKPAALHAHPLMRGEPPTLAHVVAARFPEVATASEHPREGGLVHRLDEHTSGVTVFARSPADWVTLRDAFAGGAIDKRYLAVVAGRLERELATEAPIAHHPTDPSRMVVAEQGEPHRGEPLTAFTTVSPVVVGDERSLVLVACRSGRRHQVRVHCAHLAHPLVGDPLYGGPPAGEEGPLLHAAALKLPDGRVVSAAVPERLWRHVGAGAAARALVEDWLHNAPFRSPPPPAG